MPVPFSQGVDDNRFSADKNSRRDNNNLLCQICGARCDLGLYTDTS